MANNQRMLLTEEEKLAQNMVGFEGTMMNMSENKIEDMFEKERARKFNAQVDEYADKLEKHVNDLQEASESLGANMDLIEIKPMFNRILIKPFKQNPFQRIRYNESGLIIDTGGMAPEFKNMDNGKIEQMEQMIITGAVQEVGPEVKYIVPGDVIMYRKETAMPVPFYKQGLMCIAETQVIAVINEELEQRFNNIKENGRQ